MAFRLVLKPRFFPPLQCDENKPKCHRCAHGQRDVGLFSEEHFSRRVELLFFSVPGPWVSNPERGLPQKEWIRFIIWTILTSGHRRPVLRACLKVQLRRRDITHLPNANCQNSTCLHSLCEGTGERCFDLHASLWLTYISDLHGQPHQPHGHSMTSLMDPGHRSRCVA